MSHSEIQDGGIRMRFVGVRRSLGRITGDVGLIVEVAWRLRSLDRREGRARLPGRLGMLAREIEEKLNSLPPQNQRSEEWRALEMLWRRLMSSARVFTNDLC